MNYVSGASLAALLLPYIETLGLVSISLVAPLMVLAYVTFRTAMGRIADANKHLLELNKLYLSTIETLAMAIDAKDQITHGHVRRVQAYAIGLAREIGIEEESELKAIEAAALLHDMGKLAIPEHILNKPGKLTPAEFETMKRHADIGADCTASGFLDSGLTVFASTRPRPARRGRVAPARGFGSRTSPASSARCTSA